MEEGKVHFLVFGEFRKKKTLCTNTSEKLFWASEHVKAAYLCVWNFAVHSKLKQGFAEKLKGISAPQYQQLYRTK